MVKCKYEGTGIWNGRCTGTKEVDPCPGYDKCKQYKPNYTTNADRIRAMSDEELAAHIPCPYEHDVYGDCKFGRHKRTQTCEECKLEWLKQPIEGAVSNS